MAIEEKLYTVAEFLKTIQLPENEGKRLELIGGMICEMAPSSKINTIIAARFVRYLGNFVDENNLGYVTGADGGFQLGPHEVRIPDAAFIAKARVSELAGTVFPVAPDLAVEVISPSETSRMIHDKISAYLQAGTQFVWVIYPEDKVIEAWTPADDGMTMKTLGENDTLNGGDALPGLELPVKSVFPE